MNQKTIAQGVELILKGIGVDLTDPNFAKTPQRVARMYAELLTPQENNWTTFPSTYDNMVILRAHRVIALCPHHLMPVELKAYVGYIPNEKVLGLSKLARVVEAQLTVPIMQEELGDRVSAALHSQLKPKGVAVVLSGTHGCMRFRGVRTDGDVVSSSMHGVFLLNQAARDEFFRIIGRP